LLVLTELLLKFSHSQFNENLNCKGVSSNTFLAFFSVLKAL
jgi:hypothetical protein